MSLKKWIEASSLLTFVLVSTLALANDPNKSVKPSTVIVGNARVDDDKKQDDSTEYEADPENPGKKRKKKPKTEAAVKSEVTK